MDSSLSENMKYTNPLCETVALNLGRALLVGSDGGSSLEDYDVVEY